MISTYFSTIILFFIKELIPINQDFVVFVVFLSLTILFIFLFNSLLNIFEDTKLNIKTTLKTNTEKEQQDLLNILNRAHFIENITL